MTLFTTCSQTCEKIKPRNILSLSSEEKQKFLDSFDHVFSDIDGVVWNMTSVFEGAAEGFKMLRQAGKQLTFITNNSVRSEEQCLKKLRNNDIDIESHNLVHPAKSVVEYLNSINFKGLIYLLAVEEFTKVLRQAGYKVLDGPNVVIPESMVEILRLVCDEQPVKAVIIDSDFNLSYLKLMKAYHYLRQPDCLLIGGATDYHLPITKDIMILGPGPFLDVIKQASGKEALTFGKPGLALAQVLMQRSHLLSPERALMIGDMLNQDVRFATSCGFQSLLVLTGGCSYANLMLQTDASLVPDYYAKSMADFIEFMRELNKINI